MTTELNTDLIFNLIKWAEQDESMYDQFKNWGMWDQGHWASVDVTGLVTFDEYDEASVDQDAIKKAVLNGECQTAYCMAGQTVSQSGYRMLFDDPSPQDEVVENMDWSVDTHQCIKQEPTGGYTVKGLPIMRDVPNAEYEEIDEVAKNQLGLNWTEADLFFDGNNEIEDLKELANQFCNERGLPLMFPTHQSARHFV